MMQRHSIVEDLQAEFDQAVGIIYKQERRRQKDAERKRMKRE